MSIRLIAITALAVTLLSAQPAFDVVSVRPNPLPAGHFMFRVVKQQPGVHLTGDRYSEKQTTLQDLIMDAYGVLDYAISGMPEWAKPPRGERYEVLATVLSGTTPSQEQLQLMLQKLLADRFHLKVHREKKNLPVYVLIPGKGGHKLQEKPDGTTIASAINLIALNMEYPVIDKTSLTGTWDFSSLSKLNWTQLGQEHRADPMSHSEALVAAVEDQLGLKLELRKEPMDIIVVDAAEKPSANQ